MIDYCLIITNQTVQLLNLLQHLKENNITNIVAGINKGKTSDVTISILQDRKIPIAMENVQSLDEHYKLGATLCINSHIFFIHADEFPSIHLMRCLPQFVNNSGINILAIPRMNYVIPPIDIDQLIFPPDKLHRINWPDMQIRVFKREMYNNHVYATPQLEPFAILRINPLKGVAIE